MTGLTINNVPSGTQLDKPLKDWKYMAIGDTVIVDNMTAEDRRWFFENWDGTIHKHYSVNIIEIGDKVDNAQI